MQREILRHDGEENTFVLTSAAMGQDEAEHMVFKAVREGEIYNTLEEGVSLTCDILFCR